MAVGVTSSLMVSKSQASVYNNTAQSSITAEDMQQPSEDQHE